jgi:hypothetical protein
MLMAFGHRPLARLIARMLMPDRFSSSISEYAFPLNIFGTSSYQSPTLK